MVAKILTEETNARSHLTMQRLILFLFYAHLNVNHLLPPAILVFSPSLTEFLIGNLHSNREPGPVELPNLAT